MASNMTPTSGQLYPSPKLHEATGNKNGGGEKKNQKKKKKKNGYMLKHRKTPKTAGGNGFAPSANNPHEHRVPLNGARSLTAGPSLSSKRREGLRPLRAASFTPLPVMSNSHMLADLVKNLHPVDFLKQQGYVTEVPEEDSYEKCQLCKVPNAMKHSIFGQGPDQCIVHRGRLVPSKSSEDPEHTTYFWTCCPNGIPLPSCRSFHQPHNYGCRPSEYASPPPPFTARIFPARRALSIDCEMGGVGRMSQLIQLVVLDYLTGEQLINTLVMAPPGLAFNDFRTLYSGVTRKAYQAAIKNNTILRTGWNAARSALFKIMDSNTIIVGHNVKEDLRALRIAHDKIVDSQLLVQLAANLNEGVALKRILAEVVGREVQNHGSKGHDCHEDALAARDAVLWLIEKRGNTEQWLEELKFNAEEKRRIQNERAMQLMEMEQERKRKVWDMEARMVLDAVKPVGVWVADEEGVWDIMPYNAAERPWGDVEEVGMGLGRLAIRT